MSETIVIGGGIAGLSAAWRLCREGRVCTVVEAEKAGSGASRVAAGYCQPALEPGEISSMEWESLRLWPQMARELEAETGCEIDFRADGQLRIAYPEVEAEVLADAARRREFGWQVRELSGGEARALEPGLSEEVSAAVLLPQVSWVDGRKACAALAAAIEARGGRIVEGVRVDRLITRDRRVRGVENIKRSDAGGPGAGRLGPPHKRHCRIACGPARFLQRQRRHPDAEGRHACRPESDQDAAGGDLSAQ